MDVYFVYGLFAKSVFCVPDNVAGGHVRPLRAPPSRIFVCVVISVLMSSSSRLLVSSGPLVSLCNTGIR